MQFELFHFVLLLACAMVYLSPPFCHRTAGKRDLVAPLPKAESLCCGQGKPPRCAAQGQQTQHDAVETGLALKPKALCLCHTFGYRPRALHCQLHKQQPKLKFCFTG